MSWELVAQIIVLLFAVRIFFPITGISKVTWRKS